MAKYEIVSHEFYHAGGGTYLTICEVELIFPTSDLYSPSELEQFKQAGEEIGEYFFRTEWVVVGCGYLNVYDVKPFQTDTDFSPSPVETFELDDYDPIWVMEQYPGLDLLDYCDPYWFYFIDANNRPSEDPGNLLYNVCCYLDKFNQNSIGYIG